MISQTIARDYAATLFELARRHDSLESFAGGMDTVAELLDKHPSFGLFLETPRIPDSEKEAVLEKVFRGRIPDLLLSFLKVTIRKRRQRLLGLMGREFRALLDRYRGRVPVVVTVARKWDPSGVEELVERLSALLGREAVPRIRVNPAILGGVHVRVGDTVLDGTLRRRLRQIRRQLLNAPLPSTDLSVEGDAGDEQGTTS